jgi:hypothetical protein
MVHQNELEHALVLIFGSRAPDAIGKRVPGDRDHGQENLARKPEKRR